MGSASHSLNPFAFWEGWRPGANSGLRKPLLLGEGGSLPELQRIPILHGHKETQSGFCNHWNDETQGKLYRTNNICHKHLLSPKKEGNESDIHFLCVVFLSHHHSPGRGEPLSALSNKETASLRLGEMPKSDHQEIRDLGFSTFALLQAPYSLLYTALNVACKLKPGPP